MLSSLNLGGSFLSSEMKIDTETLFVVDVAAGVVRPNATAFDDDYPDGVLFDRDNMHSSFMFSYENLK
jgi:hypothetical protein